MELLQHDPHKELRVIFILAEKDRNTFKQQPVPPDYMDWRDHIYEKDPPYLAQVEFPNDALVKELNQLIDNKVSPHIRAALTRIVEEAP